MQKINFIEPSFFYLEDLLSGMTVAERIEYCTRICYNSRDKITRGGAVPFVKGLIEKGHGSALEMARITVLEAAWDYLCGPKDASLEDKFIDRINIGDYKYALSGSFRAFIPRIRKGSSPVDNFLNWKICDFYSKLLPNLPNDQQWHAVEIVCSRSTSHQLVRHRQCAFLQESQRYCRYDKEINFICDDSVVKTMAEYAARNYCTLIESFGKAPQEARAVLPECTATRIIVYAPLWEWKIIFDQRCGGGADPETIKTMVPVRNYFKARGFI